MAAGGGEGTAATGGATCGEAAGSAFPPDGAPFDSLKFGSPCGVSWAFVLLPGEYGFQAGERSECRLSSTWKTSCDAVLARKI